MYTIVIADDEQRICDAIKGVITSSIPDLEIAGVFCDGEELYQYLLTHHVDIVLTDIEMPGKTGLEIAKLIDEQGHKSHVIMITAYHEFDYAKMAIDYRVDTFVTKPFSSHQMVQEIQNILLQKKSAMTENWAVYRGLLQLLCINRADITAYEEIRLCRNSCSIKELNCTEVVLQSEYLNLLTSEQTEALVKDLIAFGEYDDLEQSVFFIQKRTASVTFLIFSKTALPGDIDILAAIHRVVENHTGEKASHNIRAFDSFSAYLTYLAFSKEMETFFKILADSGLHSAESWIESFLQTCPEERRRLFPLFLEDNYGIKPAASDTCSLMQSVKTLVDQMLEDRSGNYIVDATREYVRRNFMQSTLSLQSAADALSVSSGYLSRIFKNRTGQNFSRYLQNVRMEQAQYLLRTTTMSTNDIAVSVGYSNPTYFRTSFKSSFGITPRQYRQNQLGGNGFDEI